MALTDAEEEKVRAVLSAFDGAKTLGELPVSTDALKDLKVEVLDSTGESGIIKLTDAIASAMNAVCGRYWNRTASSPVAAGYFGSLDMLRNLPDILGLGGYLVSDDRTMRKLDPANHNRFADGSPAALDGSMGQYMWCWQKHYYAWWVEGNNYYEAVSLNPIKGKYNYVIPAGGTSILGAGVLDRTNSKLCSLVSDDPRYRGGANDTSWDGSYRSQLGKVSTNYTVTVAGTCARKRGEGWEAGWFTTNAVVSYLTRIILGTRHIQAAVNTEKDANGLYQGGLGAGVTGASSWWSNTEQFYYRPFIPTSLGIDKGDYLGVIPYDVKDEDGTILQTFNVPSFFGLKNFYGHIGLIERGTLIQKLDDGSGDLYVSPSLYDGFNGTFDGMIKAAVVPVNNPAGWKYITELSMQNLCHAPTIANGTSVTYYADGFYNDNKTEGVRCCFRRGYAYYGANAGLGYLDIGAGLTSANVRWSSPLCFSAEDVSPVPVLF